MLKQGKYALYITIGVTMTIFAIIGVILPGVPASIFIIAALWAFSRSSERLHDWMIHIPILRPAIKETYRFLHDRTVDRRIRIIAPLSSWVSCIAILAVTHSLLLSLCAAVTAVCCTLFMIITPSRASSKPLQTEPEID